MDDGSPRFQAARWVISLGRLYWGLLVVGAAWSLLGVLLLGSAAALVVPVLLAGWASAWGALLRAFAAHRRGAWQLLVALAAVGVVAPAVRWLLAGPPSASGLVAAGVHAGLLILLLHEDSREWSGAGPRRRSVRVARQG
jgi:hypothetical protein